MSDAAPLDAARVPADASVSAGEDAAVHASTPTSAADAFAWAFDCGSVATPTSGKSIGHTSVVFKVELSSGKKAAWKPNARKVKERWRGEIAAFRLAQALDIPNVPPACAWTFDATAARAALAANANAAKLFGDEVIVEQDKVHGAVIPWIDGLRFWPIEKDPLRGETRSWLAGGEVPATKLDLARQASDLVAFDFITGNWDRHSGENVGLDPSGTHVLFIDNDAAFMDRPPPEQLARNRSLVETTARFSRSFIAAVRGLDRDKLVAALGEVEPGRPLLADAVVTSVQRRIGELLAIVDAKVREHGEAGTLYFP